MGPVAAALRNRALTTLMLGHLTVDSYVGVLPVLYPLLLHRFRLSLATVGLVTLAYTGMSSISQPFFGLLADRFGTRLVGLPLAWTAATFAAVGFAPSFPALLTIAAFSGLGSGAFHPLGAVTVRRLLPARGANTAMALYVTGGTLGVGLGPLIGVALFSRFGTGGTGWMLLPGVCIACYLVLVARPRAADAAPRRAGSGRARVPLLALAATILVMASRSWTTTTLQAFTPTWYQELGYQPWFYGPLASVIIFSSAFGTVGTGTFADRHGRRRVILVSLLLSVPAVALFVAFPGPLGFLWAVLIGALAASTAPLMLMLAQELIAGRTGFASGLILGLGFSAGAVGVPLTGYLGDRLGLQTALALQVAVVAATIPLALLLPTEEALARLRRGPAAPGPAVHAAGPEPIIR